MKSHAPFEQKVQARLNKPRSYRVILRRCDTVDPDAVQSILRESLQDLDIRPTGKALIKPNVVSANRQYIHHSYTDPRIVAETTRLLFAQGADDVTIGESGGYGIPSRLFMHEAGYLKLKHTGARVVDLNTENTHRVELKKAMHHRQMSVAKSLYEADFLCWMPKLKYHICCTTTCALKLNIGILTHKERMLYHDDRLDEKIVDLLEVGYPDIVITDAVEVGHGYESAPNTVHLGAILVADDPVAMDIVANQVLGYRSEECVHLTMAMERGYGPANISDVTVTGDVELSELQAKTAGVESEYQNIHRVNTPIRFYCGTDPDRGRFCHGGCLAAIKGCLGTIDKRRPGSVARAKPGAIVTGIVDGDVDAGDGTALLIGSCTQVLGQIKARKIKRMKGCPIGTKQLFFTLPFAFGLPSPMLDFKDAVKFVYFSLDKLIRRLIAFMTN